MEGSWPISVFFLLFHNPIASSAEQHSGLILMSYDTGELYVCFFPTRDHATAGCLEQGRCEGSGAAHAFGPHGTSSPGQTPYGGRTPRSRSPNHGTGQ